MKLHRFFVPPQSLFGRIIKINDAAISKQISKVLRLKPEEEIIFLDGDGFEYVARLIKITSREIEAEILNRQINKNEAELKITLFQALPKKDKFEWILQKCTEVGVNTFQPILSERSEKKVFNLERTNKITKEAAEQSERGIIPEILEPVDFDFALRRVSKGDVATIILDSRGEAIGRYAAGTNLYALNIFVGPEGGWSDREIDRVREFIREGANIEIVNLGPRVLRTETAGLVATSVMLNRQRI